MSSFIPKGIGEVATGALGAMGVALSIGIGATIFPIMTQALAFSPNQAFVNAVSLSYMLARYYLGNVQPIQPAAVIAGIPLGSVEELSHGISDRQVKYRANGGIFLAHQHGGNESLRIVGKAWGPNRFLFLNMLDFLFLWGSSNIIDVFAQTLTSGFWGQQNVPTLADTPPLVNPKLLETKVDPWKEIELTSFDEGYRDNRMTFPVITRNRIYVSMYIETYTWRQDLDRDKRKVVTYTIFFRKYEPEQEYEFGNIIIPAKEEGEEEYYMKAYRKPEKADKPLATSYLKAGLEIFPTLFINAGQVFNPNNWVKFAGQMLRNYFGVDSFEKGRIPGIIEQRGFF